MSYSLIKSETFYNSLVFEAIMVKETRLKMESLGIDLTDWANCEAKRVLFDFLKEVDQGEGAAKHRAIGRLNALSLEELPFDLNLWAGRFESEKEVVKGTYLGRAIAENPSQWLQISMQAGRSDSGAIKVFHAQEDVVENLKGTLSDNVSPTKPVIIPGWENLSKAIGGFNPSRISIIAAATGIGKTNLALNLATSAIESFPVLYFNMEMSIDDVMMRITAAGSGTSHQAFADSQYQIDKIVRFIDKFKSQKPLYISDGKTATITQIIGKAMAYAEEQGVKLVIVDYDQKIRSKGGTEEWKEILSHAEDLEQLAISSGVHVILLAQANDEGNPRASIRMKQPASAVLRLYKHDSEVFLLEATKNRFGKNGAQIVLNYQPEMSFLAEAMDQKIPKIDLTAKYRK